jgi:hypothetical protein
MPKEDGDTTYYALNGDFREEFENVFPKGKEACVNLYRTLAKQSRSSWSMDIFDSVEKDEE